MQWRNSIVPLIFIGLILFSVQTSAQERDSSEARKAWEVRGYVKDLQSLTLNNSFDSLVTGNLIHNRVNVRWFPSPTITAGVEFRNRLFWGEEVRLTPDFSSNIRNNNEAVDLSILWFETESMVLQTNIDRMWLEYHGTRWDARLGRQRINWGISTIWNPNDIFNTYNFLDFDYEERPGRDAVKALYHFSAMSSVEVAAAAANQNDKAVASIRYLTNKWNYDFQFSGGVYHQIPTLGAGFSGSILDAGFKGELQYFFPHRDTVSQVNLTIETDYMFEKGWYLNAGGLFNSSGIDTPVENMGQLNFQLSPQSLMPTKWNTVFTVAKEFTPLLSGNLTTIYAPGTNLLILLPSLKFNMADNLDFDFIWQSFFAEQNNSFEGIIHRAYIRLKWNF